MKIGDNVSLVNHPDLIGEIIDINKQFVWTYTVRWFHITPTIQLPYSASQLVLIPSEPFEGQIEFTVYEV